MPDSTHDPLDRDPRLKQLIEALQRLEAQFGTMQIEIPFPLVLTLISQLQLALRHPHNAPWKSPSAIETLTVVNEWIDALAELEPVLGPILRAGFNPAEDVEPEQPQRRIIIP